MYALKAADALEDADWALQLREAAVQGGKASVYMEYAVVEVLLKAGRLEEARAVLKVNTSGRRSLQCFEILVDAWVDGWN